MLKNLFKVQKKIQIYSPVNGKCVDLKDVNDQMFAEKIMGDGIAFKYNENTIYSPCKGKIVAVASTKHALGIETEDGIEILIHVGINTVNANGKGFTLFSKKQGDQVKAGDPILKINIKELKKMYEMPIMLIITNTNHRKIEFIKPQQVKRGQKIIL